IAGTLAISGYNIADTYFVGQLPGAEPLAAMGFTFPVIMLVGCVFHGLSAGVMTTAAQAIGGQKRNKAAKLISSGLLLVFILSILIATIGMSTTNHVFSLFGASGETLMLTKGYMNIWYFGCATAALSMTGNSLLISVGKVKTASSLMVMGMLINVVLDPAFIFGFGSIPAMGIRGAAVATIISQMATALSILWILCRQQKLLRFEKIPWRQLKRAWGIMVVYAVPASIGMLMMPIGSAIITRVTAEFGDVAVAATAAAGRLEMVAFVFPMALGIGLMPMIGQNFGARLYERIRMCRRFSMRFAFCFLAFMAVIYFIFADVMVRHFSHDKNVQEIMAMAMRIIPWGFGMIEVHRYAGFFFIGCGRPAVAAWLNGLRIIGLMIPFSLLALYFHSLAGLFWARLAADVIAGTVGFLLARRMTERLPQNGEPPLVKAAGLAVVKKMLPQRLQSLAADQSDIDNRNNMQ
ncbi:MAG: MATE family efflux transporter, partial [Victivallaceae bacterium]